jgi:hypothetical protein
MLSGVDILSLQREFVDRYIHGVRTHTSNAIYILDSFIMSIVIIIGFKS